MIFGYAISDIRLNDIRNRGRADSIAVGNLSMGEPCAMNLVQFKQDLAAFQNSFTNLIIYNTDNTIVYS